MPDTVFSGGPKARAKANIAALHALNRVARPGYVQTTDDLDAMRLFSGWGCLSQLFDESDSGWADLRDDLSGALVDCDVSSLGRGVLDSHYTDPAIIRAMWEGITAAGFTGGKVLEPGCGAGYFRRFMPPSLEGAVDMTGIERDPIAARIASALHDDLRVIERPYQDVALANGAFDLCVGNVPFGSVTVSDPLHRGISKFSLHEYFIAKSIEKVRPGGLLMVVTSRYFLDSMNTSQREWVDRRAELIGAVRLPAGAFRSSAGTEVVADIVVLRRRQENRSAQDRASSWVDTEYVTLDDGRRVVVGSWFADHPDCVLGELVLAQGAYREQLSVTRKVDDSLWSDLESRLIALCRGALLSPSADPTSPSRKVFDSSSIPSADTRNDGELIVLPDGQIAECVIGDGERLFVDTELSGKRAERVRGLVDVATRVRELLRAEAQESDQMKDLRHELNVSYDRFTAEHGPINGRANVQVFRQDPRLPLVASLEVDFEDSITPARARSLKCDPRPARWRKAEIFNQPINLPAKFKSPKTPKDALVQSMARFGCVRIGVMAGWLKKSERAVIDALAGQIFFCPENKRWEHANIYLGGNVRSKLEIARQAAEHDPAYQANIAALESVQPAFIQAADISAPINAPWIPGQVLSEFIEHLLGDPPSSTPAMVAGEWMIDIVSRGSDTYTQVWGTERRPANNLIERILNNRPLTVYDRIEEYGTVRRVVNVQETAAAQGKAEEIKDAWDGWVWACPSRRQSLEARYNRIHNTHVPTNYDGGFLLDDAGCLPGMNRAITLRKTQVDAVWQGLVVGSSLMDHRVGAGKTFAAIAQSMEMVRMGLAKKIMIVVPNHIVTQWGSEAARLWPSGRILCASRKDFQKSRRRRLLARIATGSWDIVIIPFSSFKFIRPPAEARFSMLSEMQEAMRDALDSDTGDVCKGSASYRRIQARLAGLEARIERLMNSPRRDDLVDFDELGIDHLVIDESQAIKSLMFFTNQTRVLGLGNPEGSEIAFDAFCKIRWLQDRHQGRGVTLLTGTPISNSMAEMFTVLRYLCYPTLVERDIHTFDAWARAFAVPVESYELSVAGTYKLVTRFAQFVNVPELMKLYRHHAHVVTREDLEVEGNNWVVPKIHGGGPEAVVCPRSPAQAAYMETIVERYDNLGGVDPSVDNALKILSDSRKCALDFRLIAPSSPPFMEGKVFECGRRVMGLYRKFHAVRGTQLVFCDLSTPSGAPAPDPNVVNVDDQDSLLASAARFSVYDDLRRYLIELGIPADEIAFMHSAKTDEQKFALQERVRQGKVRVLLSSTALGGTGMNIQDRLVALHDLDCPWRPSDLEQRRGRIERPGSVLLAEDPNFEIHILRYGTELSGDSRMFQIIESKARFIEQLRAGTDERVIEDIAGEICSAGEMKAILSGNPLILAHFTAQNELAGLERQERAWRRRQLSMTSRMSETEGYRNRLAERVASIRADVSATQNAREWVPGASGVSLAELGAHLGRCYMHKMVVTNPTDGELIGHYRGLPLYAWIGYYNGRPARQVALIGDYLNSPIILQGNPYGPRRHCGRTLLAKLDQTIEALPMAEGVEQKVAQRIEHDRQQMRKALNRGFRHTERLKSLRKAEALLADALSQGLDTLPDDADDLSRSLVGHAASACERPLEQSPTDFCDEPVQFALFA